MNVIFTMGGYDARLRREGVAPPAYMATVAGRSVLEWCLESLRHFFSEQFIFMPLKTHKAERFIHERCEVVGLKNVLIKELSAATKGQASTAHAAKAVLRDPREPIVIFGTHAFIKPSELVPQLLQGDGWLACFRSKDAALAYLDFDQMLRVVEVTDQQRISDFAVAGFYYFRSFELFESCRTQYHYIGHKEHSVPPLYSMLAKLPSKNVYTFIISSEAVHPFGSKAQFEEFAGWINEHPIG